MKKHKSLSVNDDLAGVESRLRHNNSPATLDCQGFEQFMESHVRQTKTKKPFSLPKIYDAGGDAGKQWFVHWNGWDCRVAKHHRMKVYLDMRASAAARYAAAREIIAFVVQQGIAHDGYFYPNAATAAPEQPALTIAEVMRQGLELKRARVTARSFNDYSSYGNTFLHWCAAQHLSQWEALNKQTAVRFLNAMQVQKHISNKTYNNYKCFLGALFSPLVQAGVVAVNPFAGIRKLPVEAGDAHPPFSVAQREALKRVYLARFPWMFTVAAFIYYAMLRPIEVMRLQRKHLDFDARIIRLPQALAKKDRRHPRITPPFLAFLVAAGIDKLPDNYFIIGDEGAPCADARPARLRRRMMEIRQVQAVEALVKEKIFFEAKQRMYSWKSTGAIDLLEADVHTKHIQGQAGHASVATTEIYLKSKGAMDRIFVREMDAKQPVM